MQIQEIITYIIVAVATGFVLYSLIRTLFPTQDKISRNGCSGGCNCDAKEMREELMSKKFGIPK